MEIKWITLENEDGSKLLKQHGYVHQKRVDMLGDKYNGNAALCNKNFCCAESPEVAISWGNIVDYLLTPNEDACKKCLKIYNNFKKK